MESTRHVLIRSGDRLSEVAAAIKEAGGEAAAGIHRHFFVTRANQTVVMADSPESPIVGLLRRGGGWEEPGDQPLS